MKTSPFRGLHLSLDATKSIDCAVLRRSTMDRSLRSMESVSQLRSPCLIPLPPRLQTHGTILTQTTHVMPANLPAENLLADP